MDLYGALQFCSIGILAVPITVKESETFFKEKGRNTVYVWTGLLLAGKRITSPSIAIWSNFLFVTHR